MLSIFDLFKVGIGPSSSHTVGPMLAAQRFIETLRQQGRLAEIRGIEVTLYGSLALTGHGHHTDLAVWFGLAGDTPDTIDVDSMPGRLASWKAGGNLTLGGDTPLPFAAIALVFEARALPLHENGMRLQARFTRGDEFSETWYSLGGGFIAREAELSDTPNDHGLPVPFPFNSAANLVALCQREEISIAHLMQQNEQVWRSEDQVLARCEHLWQIMQAAIQRGCQREGVLAGPLRVPRRAAALYRQLTCQDTLSRDPMLVMDWVNTFALAVSEENAAGGRIVTAPTNGAAGILPAVLAYYDRFVQPVDREAASHFLLTAGAIGLLYKMNASLSGAEVGCQGEVGVACSMAAAGLTGLMGGSPEQVCQAAEIGMEHNLGLTCDPVGGQVQVPCIERNAIAAVKAINASRMALRRTSKARVSLDKVIETMYATGKDMDARYRETSRGGLAIRIAQCD